MPFTVDITADVDGARKFYTELDKKAIASGSANALNVVARSVRRLSLNEVAKIRKLKKSRLRNAIRLTARASRWDLRAVIEAHGASIPLKDYSARQNAIGVTVNVTGKRKLIRHAFGPGYTARGRVKKGATRAHRPQVLGGHVFVRVGRRRLPIKQLFGPGVASAFVRDVVRSAQERLVRTEYPRILAQKLGAQLRKLRAKYAT